MAKRGYCHCDAPLINGERCAFKCPPEADPEHLRIQAAKRAANDAHRGREDHWTITDAEKRRMNNAIARFDPFFRRAQKRAAKASATRYAMGGKRS